jgi:hypothetical protein
MPIDPLVLQDLARMEMPDIRQYHEPEPLSEIVKSMFFNGHVDQPKAIEMLERYKTMELVTQDQIASTLKSMNTYAEKHGGSSATSGVSLPPAGLSAPGLPAPGFTPPGMSLPPVPQALAPVASSVAAPVVPPVPASSFSSFSLPQAPAVPAPVIPQSVPAPVKPAGIPGLPSIPGLPTMPSIPGIPGIPTSPVTAPKGMLD